MKDKRLTIWFLLSLILAVLVLSYFVTAPFLRPLAFAIILAVVFSPFHRRIRKWLGPRPGIVAIVSTLIVLFAFALPTFVVLFLAANQAAAMAHFLGKKSAEQGGLTMLLLSVANPLLQFVGRWIDLSKYNIHSVMLQGTQRASIYLLNLGASMLGNVANFFGDTALTFFALFFVFRDGGSWAERAGTVSPLSREQIERLLRNISDTIVANVYGILSVGAAQGLLTGIALHIVGVPSSLLLGLGAAFASVIPIIGAALVWVPAAIYFLFTGAIGKGIFLLLWGTIVVSTVDNVLRPLVVAGRVELHPLVLLFFILGGVKAFGFLGLFLGPVIASVLLVSFGMLREELRNSNSGA